MLCLTKNRHSWLLGKVYCLGVEVRYQKPFVMPLMMNCFSEALKNCCVNSDSPSVLGEEICCTPDFLISEQSVLF